ncbi:MAG TPA: hypothetical protein VGQ94_09460 [Terriglobales bacterium]|nr:hypothetical protein [Terriglobales bacterium]
MSKRTHRPESSSAITRRAFARSAALAAATIAVLPANAFSQAAAPSPSPAAPSPPEGSAPPKLSAASQAEVEARVQGVMRQFGDRLSGAQKAEVRRLITLGQEGVESLRAFPLSISDEPATVLKLRRGGKR